MQTQNATPNRLSLIKAIWNSKCAETGTRIEKGAPMYYDYEEKKCYCLTSEAAKAQQPAAQPVPVKPAKPTAKPVKQPKAGTKATKQPKTAQPATTAPVIAHNLTFDELCARQFNPQLN